VFYVTMFRLYVPVEIRDSCFYITLCNTAVPEESNDSCSL